MSNFQVGNRVHVVYRPYGEKSHSQQEFAGQIIHVGIGEVLHIRRDDGKMGGGVRDSWLVETTSISSHTITLIGPRLFAWS